MKIKQKDIELFSALRKNGRMSLTNISKETHIPVSTVFEKLRQYTDGIIKKYTVLLDFGKLGYTIRVCLVLKVGCRDKLLHFLDIHPNVNNVYRINNGYDVLCEALFKDIHAAESFLQALEEFTVMKLEVFYVLEDVKREGFFAETLCV
ncbi:MAG: Lrp/AsnC family transcriptional regulator [Candidatus Woesearchaeota archaeon]